MSFEKNCYLIFVVASADGPGFFICSFIYFLGFSFINKDLKTLGIVVLFVHSINVSGTLTTCFWGTMLIEVNTAWRP